MIQQIKHETGHVQFRVLRNSRIGQNSLQLSASTPAHRHLRNTRSSHPRRSHSAALSAASFSKPRPALVGWVNAQQGPLQKAGTTLGLNQVLSWMQNLNGSLGSPLIGAHPKMRTPGFKRPGVKKINCGPQTPSPAVPEFMWHRQLPVTLPTLMWHSRPRLWFFQSSWTVGALACDFLISCGTGTLACGLLQNCRFISSNSRPMLCFSKFVDRRRPRMPIRASFSSPKQQRTTTSLRRNKKICDPLPALLTLSTAVFLSEAPRQSYSLD